MSKEDAETHFPVLFSFTAKHGVMDGLIREVFKKPHTDCYNNNKKYSNFLLEESYLQLGVIVVVVVAFLS